MSTGIAPLRIRVEVRPAPAAGYDVLIVSSDKDLMQLVGDRVKMLAPETGGMLEVWADLYGLTQDEVYIDLLRRYDRPRLFERLLAGEDPLTAPDALSAIAEAPGPLSADLLYEMWTGTVVRKATSFSKRAGPRISATAPAVIRTSAVAPSAIPIGSRSRPSD